MYEKEESKELYWNIYVDRSQVCLITRDLQRSLIFNGITDFVGKIKNNNADFDIFSFSEKVEKWAPGNKEIDGSSTNISSVFDHINSNVNNNPTGAVLVSDGQANLGSSLNEKIDKLKIPIHVIGAGDLEPMIDVQVHSYRSTAPLL